MRFGYRKNQEVERFMANPEMKAIDILLQERMPESLIVTKEKKEKVCCNSINNFAINMDFTYNLYKHR